MVDVFITNNVIRIGDRHERMSFDVNPGLKMRNLILMILGSNGKVSLATDPYDIKIELPDRLCDAITSIVDAYDVGCYLFTQEIITHKIPQILAENLDTLENIPSALSPIFTQVEMFNNIIKEIRQEKTVAFTVPDGGFTIVPRRLGQIVKGVGQYFGIFDIKFEGAAKFEFYTIRVKYYNALFEMVSTPNILLPELVRDLGTLGRPVPRGAKCVIDNAAVVDNTTSTEGRRLTASIAAISLKHHVSFSVASALTAEPR